MKKILTFLVMLLCSASILMAQGTQSSGDSQEGPKFNYQAVVRDNQGWNLVINKTLTVEVTILENGVNGTSVYNQTINNVPTTANGMASFVIGPSAKFDSIDWSKDVVVKAVFKDGETEIATVETPVMAVPYAIQADNAPVELTTEEICRYLSANTTTKESVDSILAAIAGNNNIWPYMKDTLVNYIKTQKPVVKDLALYFLSLATPEDLYTAMDSVPANVKSAVKDTVKNYIINHKEDAMDVLAAYIGKVDTNDVKEVIAAVQENEHHDAIRDIVANYAIDYVFNHKPLVWKAVKYFIDNTTIEEFNYAYEYFKSAQDSTLYKHLLAKFNGYLAYYLDKNNYLKDCEETPVADDNHEICLLVERIKNLENGVDNACPTIASLEPASADTPRWYRVTINNYVASKVESLQYQVAKDDETYMQFTSITVNPNDEGKYVGEINLENLNWGQGTKLTVKLTYNTENATCGNPTTKEIELP